MKPKDFEVFYKKNVDRIFRYVFFRVGQKREVTEDLVSEIFMKALRNFDKYDPKISQSAWIYRIAHNHLANYFRDSKTTTDIDDIEFLLVGSDGSEELIKQEESWLIKGGLDKLTVEERKIVTMKYIEGYSYKEIAEVLEKTADALKVASHRAIKKLRKLIIPKHTYVSTQTTAEISTEEGNSHKGV